MKSCYLGDGLYAEFDGDSITLWTQRESGVHRVVLDREAQESLLRFLGLCYSVKITVEQLSKEKE